MLVRNILTTKMPFIQDQTTFCTQMSSQTNYSNINVDFTIKIWVNFGVSGAVAGTADSQQEGPGFVSSLRPFLSVFACSPYVRMGTLASIC